MSQIRLQDVSFGYGQELLFDQVSLTLPDRSFIGVVGVNGSGKSTLFKLLLGELVPQQGEVLISGKKAGDRKLKKSIGIAFQEVGFPPTATPREVIRFASAHYPDATSEPELVDRFHLGTFADQRCGTLSGGMRRRVALACAFAGNPELVLLDEPSTGLDRESRLSLMETIADYQKESASIVLMITHHPQEVGGSVDQFLVLNKSKPPHLVPADTFADLSRLKRLSFCSAATLTFPSAVSSERTGDRYEVIGRDGDTLVRRLAEQTVDFSQLGIEPIPVDLLLENYL